jgi:fatty-acyl-CoA synthase
MTTLTDAVGRHATASPDKPAWIFEGVTTTFAEFNSSTNRIAAALAAAGIGPGDRIAYLGRNTAAFFELLYGAMKAGVVTVPINWRLAPPEVVAIIANSQARLLVVGREYASDPAYASLQGVAITLAAEPGHPSLPTLANWSDSYPDAPPAYVASSADIAVQLYTSGTTGLPKGVMLPHSSIASGLAAALTHDLGWNQWSAADTALLAMPVSHVSGTGWGMIALHHGATCHIQRQFDLDATFDTFANHRITRLFLVPAALQMLVRHPRARAADFSALHEVCYGASPMPLPLLRECMDVMKTPFVQFYGMTETAGTIVALSAQDHQAALDAPDAAHRLRAAGRALPWVTIRAINPNGTDAPVGTVGELVTRSHANMAGYWNRPQDTARTIDTEGWLHTGDAGYIDADGYIFIHDRVKDMIITGGENVYPAEVESALCEHPAIAEAAVIGVPDERWGETVRAFVVLRPDALLTPEDLIAWCRTRIAGFKSPSAAEFVDSLPRNASGKLLKRALREKYWKDKDRQVS